MKKKSLIHNLPHNAFQKWLRNWAYLSETILLRTSWSRTTSLKNKLTIWVASSDLWHEMKCAILLNLSTITRMESLSFWVLGSPKIKSIEIFTQGSLGTSKGVHKPFGKTLDLAFLHVVHLLHMWMTSFFHLWPIKMLVQCL